MGIERVGRLSDLLTLVDIFTIDPAYMLQDQLTLTDTFSYEHVNSFSDELTLQNVFSYSFDSTRVLSDTLTLTNNFSASTNNPNTIQNPIPIVGNPNENTQPSPEDSPGPGLGPFSAGALRYEEQTVLFTAAGASIRVKAPDFGDKATDEPTIIDSETSNLTLIQYRDHDLWNDFRLFELSWSQLDETEVALIRVFLRQTCGQVIVYTDIYGNNHSGVIPDPDQQATSSNSGFTIKFTFLEGLTA